MDQASVEAHNEEAAAVWEAFNAGCLIRPPVIWGTSTHYFLRNDHLNPGQDVTFQAYAGDADLMLDFQLRAAAWRAEQIACFCDDPISGPANGEAWLVRIELENLDEAVYFGAPLVFRDPQTPDTIPILAGDRKNALFDAGLPDPLTGGWYRKAHEILDHWRERLRREPEYRGWPVRIAPFGWQGSGPLTIAAALRGHELLTDLYTDPGYVATLLDFVVEGVIARARTHRRFFGLAELAPEMFFADDALEMLSVKMAREFMLPVYRKLKARITTAEHIKIHLCGDATRHFLWLRDELGVDDFDTGFPVDFARLRRELGPQVTIRGGPSAVLLRNGSAQEVQAETAAILNSGVCAGRGDRFILREANNLAPGTPFTNLAALYEMARAWTYNHEMV